MLREIDSLAHDIKVGQESVLERINRIDKLMRRMQTEKAINVALRRCIRKYENREDIMKILAYDAEYKAKRNCGKQENVKDLHIISANISKEKIQRLLVNMMKNS